MNQNLAVLSWKLADYKKYDEEPPQRIIENPQACEGVLMEDDELEQYLIDCLATIRLLVEKGSDAAIKLQAMYIADLDFLVRLGRLDPSDYNDLSNEDNFRL